MSATNLCEDASDLLAVSIHALVMSATRHTITRGCFFVVSIHALVMSATAAEADELRGKLVSIHALVMSATIRDFGISSKVAQFQSTRS